MKRVTPILLLTGILVLTLNVTAGETPRGSILELHSCEVYAGPCMVNSESPQGGRYMVRAWDFTAGTFKGVNLAGLQVGVLQVSTDNLAEKDSRSGNAIVYLPDAATAAQREALLAWLKSSQPDFRPAKLQTRVAALKFTKSEKGYSFTAGEFISVKTAPLSDCGMGGCGEDVWYQPRAVTSQFTVAVNHNSRVAEPLVKLTWSDTGRRSIFLARFGESNTRNVYVTLAELCGPSTAAF